MFSVLSLGPVGRLAPTPTTSIFRYQLLSICHDVLKTYMLRCSPVRTSLLLSQSLLKTRCARRRRKVRPRRYSGSLTSVTLMALAQSVRNAEKLMIHQIAKRKCYASFFALPLRGRMGWKQPHSPVRGGKKRKRKSTSAAARSQKSGATGLPLKIKLHSLLYFWGERNTERARRGVESRNSWSSDQIKCFVCRRSVLDTHKTLKFRKKTRPMVMGRCDRAPHIGPRKSPVDHCCDAGQLCVCVGGNKRYPDTPS